MQNSTDRAMNVPTPLKAINTTGGGGAGVWVIDWYGVDWELHKAPAADLSVLVIPILTILNPQEGKGARLVSVCLHWVNTVADLTSLGMAIYKTILPPTWGAIARTGIAFTYDTGNDTAAERRSQRVSRITATLDIPAYPASNESWYVELAITAALNSVISIYGFVANYVIRD